LWPVCDGSLSIVNDYICNIKDGVDEEGLAVPDAVRGNYYLPSDLRTPPCAEDNKPNKRQRASE
jgi:hypothetical protein